MYPTLRINKDINLINDVEFSNSEVEIVLSNKQCLSTLNQKETVEASLELIIDEDGETITNEEVFNLLRNKRLELAKEYGMSPAYIATNKLLIYLATYLPKNREEYLKIRFTGERSYEKYGVHFVEIIKQYLNKK